MTIPPAWYHPPRELPADFEGGTMKRLWASLPLQWWHIPNLVTETRFVGALALLPLFIVLATMNMLTPIPEDQLWTFFENTTVLAGLWRLITGINFLLAWWFAVTALTDKLDGFLAKKIFGTSALGAALDPAVDKVLMLASMIVALIMTALLDLWLVFCMLMFVALFLLVRERDVYLLKRAEAASRTDNKITSARQSGRMSMVVFCAAMTVTLMPIVGPWSSGVKSILLLTVMVFSGRSWLDYRREYGQFLKK